MLRTTQNQPLAATADTSDAVPLVGYLGAAATDDACRLYKTPELDLYVELRLDDVTDQTTADDPAQTILFVQPEAIVVWHEPMPVSTFATPLARGPRYPWPRP